MSETYLSRTDIKVLLNVSRTVAERIFNQADKIDSQMPFRVYPNKVRIQSALKVAGVDWGLLQKQIKNADALAQQSAE